MNIWKLKICILCIATAMLVGCGAKGGGVVSTDGPVTLRLKMNKGDKWTDTLTGDVKMDLTNFKPAADISPQEKKMVEDSKNDTAKFTITYDYEVSGSGAEKVEIKRTATEVKTEGTGMLGDMVKLLEMQKGSSKELKRSAKNMEEELDTESPIPAIEFPERAIKPGDSWDGTATFAGAKGKASFKFEANEEVGGKNCAKISFKPTVVEGKKVTVQEPIVVWIDTANGRTVKGTMTCGFADGPDGVLTNINFAFQQK